MKRYFLLLALFLLGISSAKAQLPSLGIGFSGGVNLPILQANQGEGTIYSIRGIIKIPLIVLQPHFSFGKYGEADFSILNLPSIQLEGSKIKSFGVDALLGSLMGAPGFSPYFLGGAGYYKMERDQTTIFDEPDRKFGWSLGLGISISATPIFELDARLKFNFMKFDSTTKKDVNLLVGLNYYFGG